MMRNYDKSVEINHNSNWPYIPNYLYKILITATSAPGKCVTELDKISTTRYWWNLFMHQRRIRTKLSITYQRDRKSKNQKVKKSIDIC